MDLLLKDLASGDTSARLAALEKVASKLPNKSWLRDISVSEFLSSLSSVLIVRLYPLLSLHFRVISK